MNKQILHTDVQHFIAQNLSSDPVKLILKGSPFPGVSIQEIAEQILAKQKCRDKLPSWYTTPQIYYPNRLNIEQSSSEVTAGYKAGLVSGIKMIDLTGGFGVDAHAFAKKFNRVIHCEINKELSDIAAYNFKVMGVENIDCIPENGLDFLKRTDTIFDLIYADPSRRDSSKNRVFLLKDSLPDIPSNLDLLFRKSDQILLKLSPVHDIKAAINGLRHVKLVHVVAVKNEVKELLFLLEKDFDGLPELIAVNILKNRTEHFSKDNTLQAKPTFSEPLTFLYEPNAAILKAGLFDEVSHAFKLHKLHKNSHLYTSDTLIDFPGRRFRILQKLKFDKKLLLHNLQSNKAHISVRNFPVSVAKIRKQTGIEEGGETYLFFTTGLNNDKLVLLTERV